ncbi:MAG: 3-hydroxybutyryl-CoA dehydrogenase [Blastocatellia bacterium AA13]|nr:MAG: 3-hydroxybutyryl-CoA dehydrogenase [Blastocatellia bacterium AA13]
MALRNVAVLGCGLMGSGIAQVCAQAGNDVTIIEVSEDLLRKGLGKLETGLNKLVERGKLASDSRDQTMSHLRGSTNLEDAAKADLVIEAIIENLDEKHKTYSQLDRICQPETVFASNTSSLSITQMMVAAGPERQRRFIGMHFFNPVPIMKLVEVVRTIVTDPDVYTQAVEFARSIGKVPVQTSDRTGFIVNRLLVPYMLDAIRALEEGVATIVDIDTAMKLGCGYPMGPFTLTDFVGLDTTYYIANIMFDEFREKRFAPPPLLKRMVMAGFHGRKSGRGFYDYQDPDNPKPLSL